MEQLLLGSNARVVSLADSDLAGYLAGVDADGLEQDASATLSGGFLEGFGDNHGHEVDIVLEDRRRGSSVWR